ncbi:hypothetical protein Tco_0367465 [Tanacetum coccineum]
MEHGNESVLDDPDVCRSLVDQLAPPGLFSQLRGMDYDQLFSEFNVGAVRQTCLGAEVRMRFEHTLRERKRLEGRCSRQVNVMKEKDVEIANLKTQLFLREAEATAVICLRGQVSAIEAAKAARVSELNSLKERNSALEEEKDVLEGKVATLESAIPVKDIELASLTAQTAKLTQDLSSLELSCDELSVKAASLESQRDGFADQVSLLETTCFRLRDQVSGYELFKEQCEAIQDEQVKVLSDCLAGLDSELMALALHLDKEFHPRFLTTIAGQRWIISRGFRLIVMKCHQSPEYVTALGTVIGLAIDKGMQIGLVVGIDHGKAGRGLADVAAYDPFVEEKYVSAVLAFRDLDFDLLSQLESQKDAGIADIINSLRLEGPSTETLEVSRLQPSYECCSYKYLVFLDR